MIRKIALILVAGFIAAPAYSETPSRANTDKSLKWVSNGVFIKAKLGDKWAEFEKIAGVPIEFTSYKQDLAFINMANGRVDFITSGPIEGLVTETKGKTPPQTKAEDFDSVVFSTLKIKAVIHPEIKVKAITHDQFADIFSGRMKSWKPITGQDIPVKFFVAKNSPVLIKGIAKKYELPVDLPAAQFVADQEGVVRGVKLNTGSIGVVSSKFEMENFNPTYIDTEATRSTFLSIRKNGRPEAKKVFEFIKQNKIAISE